MNIKERIEIIEDDDNTNDEHILHQLLELSMAVTGLGYVGDDYTKFIEFPMGGINIFSDPYYGNVQIDGTDVDGKMVKELIKEIKKRLLLFDKKICTMREQAAAEVFNKPFKKMED